MPNLNERQFEDQQLFDPGPPGDPNSPENLKKHYQELVSYNPVTVRAPIKAIPGIKGSGEILTQHDVGSSMGFFSPKARGVWEERAGFERSPVYGSVDIPDEHTGIRDRASQYGQASFRMKPEVRDRTRITLGDSLGANVNPPGLRDVESGREEVVDTTRSHEQRNHPPTRTLSPYTYIEAQIEPREGERGVPLSDVQSVDLTTASSPSTDLGRDIGKEMREFESLGVPASISKNEMRYQPPLPYSPQELLDQGFRPTRRELDDGSPESVTMYFRSNKDAEEITRENIHTIRKNYTLDQWDRMGRA